VILSWNQKSFRNSNLLRHLKVNNLEYNSDLSEFVNKMLQNW
jgi:hypothetical protein